MNQTILRKWLAVLLAVVMCLGLLPAGAMAEEGDTAENTWTVTFYDRDADVYETVKVEKGQAIGKLPKTIEREDYNAFWAIGTIKEGEQGTEIDEVGKPIDENFVPSEDTTIVPGYTKIEYTVTFYKEDKETEVASETVDVDTSYCLNDIPQVPIKSGHTGKWVYDNNGTPADFSNTVTITKNTDVWAEYEKNVFTVSFMIDDETTHQTDTYYTGDTLTLPDPPVVEGKNFEGWFDGETEYVGGEGVTSDLTLTAKFTDQFSVRFLILDDAGKIVETLSQFFRTDGEVIGTMPDNPFVAGKVFEKWVKAVEEDDKITPVDPEEEVNAVTAVKESIIALAKFREVTVYTITVKYYYDSTTTPGKEVVFNTDLFQVEAHEIPYTITPPATTQTSSDEVSGAPIYYPEETSYEVTLDDFDENKQATVEIKYVPYTAEYDFVYMLKDLEGDGYTEIDRERDVKGVLNSYVTPTVKTFDNAVLALAEGAEITKKKGQELPVYYTRKNYQLTYESNGGSYVGGVTVPYGTEQAVTSTVTTRTGYNFAGWFLDEGLTQAAGSTVTIEADTTLYAKWEGATVNYTIVYMFEKYNDAGTATSYVYDNSRDGSGTVGTTVSASSAPGITRTGWEADTAKNAESSVEIAADGSSVLYVYYKLVEYTFNFRPGTYATTYNSYNVTASLNGESRTGNNNYTYSFKAKLGQDISSLWLSASNGKYTTGGYGSQTHDVSFSGWIKVDGDSVYVTKRTILTEDMLPGSGTTVTYQGYWLTNTVTYTVNYWLQNADDNNYTRSETYSQTYNYSSNSSLSPKDIPGYTYVRRTDNGRTANLYYNRDTFKIDYYYGSTNLNTISNVKFDADINKAPYVWTPTAAQCGVDSDYTFAGWYADSGLNTLYTFSTMPASNLVLYAKWTAPNYTVSFVDNDGTTSLADSQTVVKYEKATKPTDPTKAGYTFDGWYTTADGTNLFDWNTQIIENTTVYAHWTRNTLSYTVKYVDENDNPVAQDKVVSNPNFVVGQTIEEQAIAVAGYRPKTNIETLKLTGTDEENVITFVYVEKPDKTTYTVRYILDQDEFPGKAIAVAKEKTVADLPGVTASVIESAAAVDYDALYEEHSELNGIEFFPDEAEKTLVLAADPSQNVLTFYYSQYKHVTVTVNFVDMNGEAINNADTQVLKVGNTFTLSHTPIAGWELNKAVEGNSYDGAAADTEYKITKEIAEEGSLEFTLFYQKKATITVASDSKQYDGEALTLPENLNDQVTVEGLLEGELLTGISFTYSNTDNTTNDGRINAGTATVTPKDAKTNATHNENYYAFRYISGTLTVTKINVTVRVEPDRWTGAAYTGNSYKAGFTNPSKEVKDYVLISHEGYATAYLDTIWKTIQGLDGVSEGGAGLGYYGIDKTDAGDYPYNINLTMANLPENDNYSVSLYVREGRLQILPAAATVTTGSDIKPHDGTPLTKDEASITGLVAADEGKVTVTATGTQTEVGSSPNTYTINWGEVNPDNYTITENLGTLQVTEAGPVVDQKAHLTITKETTNRPANGRTYTQGETITYKITVTNDGNVNITGISIVDKLNGFTFDQGQVTTGINLAPNESASATGSYTVTSTDVTAGKVVNVATAEGGSSPDSTIPVQVQDGTKEEPTSGGGGGGGGDPRPRPTPDPIDIDDDDVPLAPIPDALNGEDHFAYVKGYPDQTVRPEGNITRAETATMIYRLLKPVWRDIVFTDENSFSDVAQMDWFNKAVSSMANGEYITGYPDGTFQGNKSITRAEFVTIMIRFLGEDPIEENPFTDIGNHWAKDYILTAVGAGWIDGYPDGTFQPNALITRAEAMKIINSVLHRGVNETSELGNFINFPDNEAGKWYYYEVLEAVNDHEHEGERPNENWTSNSVDYFYDIVKYEHPGA